MKKITENVICGVSIIIILVCMLLYLFIGCKTQAPIIIYDTPKIEVSDDMTIPEYIENTTEWGVKIKTYIDELINQITHKVRFIDLRKNNENKGKSDGNKK